VEGVDRLILFPSLTLTAALDGQGGWPEAYRALRVWFAENLSPPPEMVINLTPNLLGAILSAALGSRKIYGLAADRRRGGFTLTPWASYGLIASRARLANPFNLVDLFVRQAGLRPDGAGLEIAVPPEVYEEVGAAIRALGLPPETSLVGILPGASRPERQWPPENFARTAEILRQQHPCHFFVLGSSREAALGEVIRSRLPAGEVTQCQGRTSVAVLAAHLNSWPQPGCRTPAPLAGAISPWSRSSVAIPAKNPVPAPAVMPSSLRRRWRSGGCTSWARAKCLLRPGPPVPPLSGFMARILTPWAIRSICRWRGGHLIAGISGSGCTA